MRKIMSFSVRLKEERKRLKITQKELAARLEITEQAQVAYEKNRLPQFANYLEKLADFGFDVGYIVTGQHGGVQLSADEAEVLALLPSTTLCVNCFQSFCRNTR